MCLALGFATICTIGGLGRSPPEDVERRTTTCRRFSNNDNLTIMLAGCQHTNQCDLHAVNKPSCDAARDAMDRLQMRYRKVMPGDPFLAKTGPSDHAYTFACITGSEEQIDSLLIAKSL